jgi:hypothetical protein
MPARGAGSPTAARRSLGGSTVASVGRREMDGVFRESGFDRFFEFPVNPTRHTKRRVAALEKAATG